MGSRSPDLTVKLSARPCYYPKSHYKFRPSKYVFKLFMSSICRTTVLNSLGLNLGLSHGRRKFNYNIKTNNKVFPFILLTKRENKLFLFLIKKNKQQHPTGY